MAEKYPMTQAGKEKLENELTLLKEKARKELDQQIRDARAFCDFHEDVSFKDMVNDRSALEERIQSLEYMLSNAEMIQPGEGASSVITLGSSVTFVELPDGDEETYTIVGTAEADPSEAKISSESPMAKHLLGLKANDEVSIQTPGGQVKIRIVQVQ